VEASAGAPAWAVWLEASGLGEVARNSLWLYPIASVLHVLGIAVLVGGILAFDLRVLGAARQIPLAAAARLLLPLARGGFAVAVVAGLVMLAADATHLAANPAFFVKAMLLLAACANVVLFHAILPRDLAMPTGGFVRASAAGSAVLWLSVAASGRAIAYF